MNTQALKNPKAVSYLTALKSAIETACARQKNFTASAFIAGQMLREWRQQYLLGHAGPNDSIDDMPHATLLDWLALECPMMSGRSAKRWMSASRRVVGHLLEIHHSNAPVSIELDGDRHFISTVLSLPEADCSAAMITFRETFNIFLQDKTLAEAVAACLDGESEPSYIDRVANGKRKGGTRGENRRDYAKFVAVHFKELSQCINRWEKIIAEQPNQHARMTEAIRAVVLGGHFRIVELGRPTDFKGWPRGFSRFLFDVLKERLRSGQNTESEE